MVGNNIWQKIQSKIQTWDEVEQSSTNWKSSGLEVVFTNGCFDILHYGHLFYLHEARAQGDKLIIGLNSKESVQRLKGMHRPINDDLTRLHFLAALDCVDAVVLFEEDTPLELIERLKPDVLVKGGDYTPDQIVGSDTVLDSGGEVKSLAFVEGYSTSNIEQKIMEFAKEPKIKNN